MRQDRTEDGSVTASEVAKRFGEYHDRARIAPVTVTKYGRDTVVILAADEYRRLKRLDREALSLADLSVEEIDAMRSQIRDYLDEGD